MYFNYRKKNNYFCYHELLFMVKTIFLKNLGIHSSVYFLIVLNSFDGDEYYSNYYQLIKYVVGLILEKPILIYL